MTGWVSIMIRTVGGDDLGHGVRTTTFYIDDDTGDVYHSGTYSAYPRESRLDVVTSIEEATTIAAEHGFARIITLGDFNIDNTAIEMFRQGGWEEKMSEEDTWLYRMGVDNG